MSAESASAEDLRMDVGALMGALWARMLRIVIVTALILAVTTVAGGTRRSRMPTSVGSPT